MAETTAEQAIVDIFQLPLNAHLPAFAEKFPYGADRQEIAQQLLIFLRGPWTTHRLPSRESFMALRSEI
jgi:hypothetical protein